MPWSDPVPLKRYVDAPNSHGVYEIGFFKDQVFNAKYIGRAAGKKVTIRSRLAKHFSGMGNKKVREYLDRAERNNLYFRYQAMTPADACTFEAEGQVGIGFEWNYRVEIAEACSKFDGRREWSCVIS